MAEAADDRNTALTQANPEPRITSSEVRYKGVNRVSGQIIERKREKSRRRLIQPPSAFGF